MTSLPTRFRRNTHARKVFPVPLGRFRMAAPAIRRRNRSSGNVVGGSLRGVALGPDGRPGAAGRQSAAMHVPRIPDCIRIRARGRSRGLRLRNRAGVRRRGSVVGDDGNGARHFGRSELHASRVYSQRWLSWRIDRRDRRHRLCLEVQEEPIARFVERNSFRFRHGDPIRRCNGRC